MKVGRGPRALGVKGGLAVTAHCWDVLEGELKEWKVCVFNEGDNVLLAERKGSEEVEEDPRRRCAEQAKSQTARTQWP